MPALTCYSLKVTSHSEIDFGDLVDPDVPGVIASNVYEGDGFSARLFQLNPRPHPVSWARFVQQGFPDSDVGFGTSPSALLIVRIEVVQDRASLFAFSFGPAGRFLLRRDVFLRGFGLRTALNMIYPTASGGGARLRAVDTKRRGQTVVRSRAQSSGQAEFETFSVNQLQDVLGKAVGVPADLSWGSRVSGSDALAFHAEIGFQELGELCRSLDAVHDLPDYKERFGWIDYIQPVSDPLLVEQLQEQVLIWIRSGEFDHLSLAPPEIVDWDTVVAFRYHFDRKRRATGAVLHRDLRVQDYAAGLARHRDLSHIDAEFLRGAMVFAVDDGEEERAKWSVWKCLVAEIDLDGATYLLDEGEFFAVSRDYLADLNTYIGSLPAGTVSLPGARHSTVEAEYNMSAAQNCPELLLLDRQTVRLTNRTSPVEICDLLSTTRQLIHVKRHLGSSDLSHLFAQGVVSAELLQSSPEFRRAAAERIAGVSGGRDGFDFISEEPIATTDFEVVYAVAARWNGRSVNEALPFFSKVNLREAAVNLRARGFRVAMQQIEAT